MSHLKDIFFSYESFCQSEHTGSFEYLEQMKIKTLKGGEDYCQKKSSLT